ncbi:PREDICTED: uncharacterized protein LOC109181280 [Ipomoea nil]|uniref:uncharacterized protein LOC109181280 n=1 Tax=Ipomoea nil TaxID=35883 RepID=UPI000901E422|nr:PREDICTED: uncharacterized protein LOC109181280 [Ipomoea nil]
MSLIAWNCRGLGNLATVQVLVDIVHSKRSLLLFLMETKLVTHKLEDIKSKLGFHGMFSVDAVGQKGGPVLFWKGDIDLNISSFSSNHIDSSQQVWRFSGFYGYPNRQNRHLSWNLLRTLANQGNQPWIVMRDFNDILNPCEKVGGRPQPQWLIRGFEEAVEQSGLRNFGFSGYQFTWEKGRGTTHWIREKLDRILVNNSWVDQFGEAKATSFEALQSDHLPIAIWPIPSVYKRRRRHFRFENYWVKESKCREIINYSWDRSMEGDCNTKFFHNSVNKRWGINSIKRFRDDARNWVQEEEAVQKLIKDYFINIFTASSGNQFPVLQEIRKGVSDSQNEVLMRGFTREEVRTATFGMHPDKSPGIDGLNPGFFQSYWDIVGDSLTSLCNEFLRTGQFPKRLNHTHIVLIPKKATPEKMADLRPIALCTVAYKIVTKAMANRLKPILGGLISDNQSAFVPGRLIMDNIMVAYEMQHFLKRKTQGREGFGALKLDMSKAYDRVEWPLLKSILLKMGFNRRWVDMIMYCVSSAMYYILKDNNEIGLIIPSRGFRQGDPLSPYLFLIVAEGFALIKSYENVGKIHGISVARSAPAVSHLFFADDSYIFFKANPTESSNLKQLLASYSSASGQSINFDKSSLCFSRNVDEAIRNRVGDILGVRCEGGSGNYLGLPMMVGRNKNQIFGFIKSRMISRIRGWNQKFILRSGREILLKSIVQAIPSYAMGVFLLPKDLIKEVEVLMNDYWWKGGGTESKGIHWKNWKKLSWRLIKYPDSLVAKIYRARYYPTSTFFEAKKCSNPSFIWSSLLETQEVLRKHTRWRVGRGDQIKIWGDNWLPDKDNSKIVSFPYPFLENATVDVLKDADGSRWDMETIRDIFVDRDADLIQKIPLSRQYVENKLIWAPEEDGGFTVKSCYKVVNGDLREEDRLMWTLIWKLKIPPKIKVFMWQLCTNCLPTRDLLRSKRVNCGVCSPLCDQDIETAWHLFVDCIHAKQCWSILGCQPTNVQASSFQDWFTLLASSLSRNQLCIVIMSCWEIWRQRNDKV